MIETATTIITNANTEASLHFIFVISFSSFVVCVLFHYFHRSSVQLNFSSELASVICCFDVKSSVAEKAHRAGSICADGSERINIEWTNNYSKSVIGSVTSVLRQCVYWLERETESKWQERIEEQEEKSRSKSEKFMLIMDYCEAVADIAKTNAIAQQNRLTITIFYQTKFRI